MREEGGFRGAFSISHIYELYIIYHKRMRERAYRKMINLVMIKSVKPLIEAYRTDGALILCTLVKDFLEKRLKKYVITR